MTSSALGDLHELETSAIASASASPGKNLKNKILDLSTLAMVLLGVLLTFVWSAGLLALSIFLLFSVV